MGGTPERHHTAVSAWEGKAGCGYLHPTLEVKSALRGRREGMGWAGSLGLADNKNFKCKSCSSKTELPKYMFNIGPINTQNFRGVLSNHARFKCRSHSLPSFSGQLHGCPCLVTYLHDKDPQVT